MLGDWTLEDIQSGISYEYYGTPLDGGVRQDDVLIQSGLFQESHSVESPENLPPHKHKYVRVYRNIPLDYVSIGKNLVIINNRSGDRYTQELVPHTHTIASKPCYKSHWIYKKQSLWLLLKWDIEDRYWYLGAFFVREHDWEFH